MKAFVLNKEKQIAELKVPVPKPGPGEVQIKLLFTGVCRTDLQIATLAPGVAQKENLILGHEGVGVVSEIGAVPPGTVALLKLGDVVATPWLAYCPAAACEGFRHVKDGTYAEYVVIDAQHAVPVPEGMAPQQAAPMSGAGLTVYKALKESGLQEGQFCVIMGAAGGLGHLAMQFAAAMGMKTVGVDVGPAKAQFVKDLGFEHALDATSEGWAKDLESIVGVQGPDAVLVVGPSELAYQQALQCVRRKGAVVAVALPPAPIMLPIRDVVIKGVRIIGSFVGSPQDLKDTLDFAVQHKVKCVLHEAPLDDAAKVHKELDANTFAGRAVLACCPAAELERSQAAKLAG